MSENRETTDDLRVYTIEEAAAILKCEAGWLKEQVRQQKVPFLELSGPACFTGAHLAAIIAAHEVLPPPGQGHTSHVPAVSTARASELVHTAEEAASIIGGSCKSSWLKDQAKSRRIPYTLIGGAYHFTDDHIREILAICEVRPRSGQEPTPRAARSRHAAPPWPPGQEMIMLKSRPQRGPRRGPPGDNPDST